MKLTTDELDGGITRVVLEGRMDIDGAAAVDLPLNVVAGHATRLLLDMQDVTFLGSMGLRSLVVPAQTVRRRGGKAVLFSPNHGVEEVLRMANLTSILPICHDLPTALAALE